MVNFSRSCAAYTVQNPVDQAPQTFKHQFHDEGQSSNPLSSHHQAREQLSLQDVQNCITSPMVQCSANSTSTVTPATSYPTIPILSINNMNPDMEMSRSSQNSIRNVIGQGLASNSSANSDMQGQGMHQLHVQIAPSRQSVIQSFVMQSASSCGIQQPSIPLPVQSGLRQHLQSTSILQQPPIQLQVQSGLQQHLQSAPSHQQPPIQLPVQSGLQQHLQSSPLQQQPSIQLQVQSGLQRHLHSAPIQQQPPIQQKAQSGLQKLVQSGLQEHVQSALVQQEPAEQICPIHQQGTRTLQPSVLPLQQQQLPNAATNIQNQWNGQQNIVPEIQCQQQVLGQNNHASINEYQSGQQTEASRLIGQSDSSSMHDYQQERHMQFQGKQPQSQPHNQQMMSQIQAHPAKLQVQPNTFFQDMQQRLQPSGNLHEQQRIYEQQKQSLTFEAPFETVSSGKNGEYTSQIGDNSGDDWKDEIHTKIITMKDRYAPEIKELYSKIAMKLKQLESIEQHTKTADYEKLKVLENTLRKAYNFLHLPASAMSRDLESKLEGYEEHIQRVLQYNGNKKPIPSLQQGEIVQRDGQSLQQPMHDGQFLQQPLAQQSMEQRQQTELQHARFHAHQRAQLHHLKEESRIRVGQLNPLSSLQRHSDESLRVPQSSSLQNHQQIPQTSLARTGSHLQSQIATLVGFPPLTSLEPPSVISSPGLSSSALVGKSNDLGGSNNIVPKPNFSDPTNTEEPFQRLLKVVRSSSSKALSASVTDMKSVVDLIERRAGSIPGNGSRCKVGEELVSVTNFPLEGEMPDANFRNIEMKRFISTTPSNFVASEASITDGFEQLSYSETFDMDSSETSFGDNPRLEANSALLTEIRQINKRLIETAVDISDQDIGSTEAVSETEPGMGTIVRCSFNLVKSKHVSPPIPSIQPLWLLVPTNYPKCSPVILDKLPAKFSVDEELSAKAKARLEAILRNIEQPVPLGEIVRHWDKCAHAVVLEYAEKHDGGSFSTRYGTWETVDPNDV